MMHGPINIRCLIVIGSVESDKLGGKQVMDCIIQNAEICNFQGIYLY